MPRRRFRGSRRGGRVMRRSSRRRATRSPRIGFRM